MTDVALLETLTPIERFRTCLLADVGLQDRLAPIEDRGRFLAAASTLAARLGLSIDGAQLDDALRSDPPCPAGIGTASATCEAWPPRQWLPTAVVQAAGGPMLEWMHFGGVALTEPFFEDSRQRARRRPLNRLIRHRTPLDSLANDVPHGARAPDGLIFHMSRCGSTLVAQMLATIPGSVVVSEAPVLDAVLHIAQTQTDLGETGRIAMLRAIVAALGRDRHDAPGPFVIKLDSWHSLALPLLRRAFPDTPWLFLYRDPLAVMASQQRMRGLHMIDAVAALDDIAGDAPMPTELHMARVLARICDAALAHRALGGGLFVDYARLPVAVEHEILPHFGIAVDAQHGAAMRQAATRDAQTPALGFTRGSSQTYAAGCTVRRATGTLLGGLYRRLDAVRREARA